MRRYGTALLAWAAVAALVGGCGDQVVGGFGAAGGTSGGTTGASPDSGGGSSVATAAEPDAGTTDETGDGSTTGATTIDWALCTPTVLEPFGGVALDDRRWSSWQTGDASLKVFDDELIFTPATSRLDTEKPADAGILTRANAPILESGEGFRLRVVEAPAADHDVLLFLMVQDADSSGGFVSIKVHPWVEIEGQDPNGVQGYRLEFLDVVAPSWIAMAIVDDEVHYQVSDDGVAWTTLHVGPMMDAIGNAEPLIMAQTYGDTPPPQPVVVDDFSSCAW